MEYHNETISASPRIQYRSDYVAEIPGVDHRRQVVEFEGFREEKKGYRELRLRSGLELAVTDHRRVLALCLPECSRVLAGPDASM